MRAGLLLVALSAQADMSALLAQAESKGYQAYVRVEVHGVPVYERGLGLANRALNVPWSGQTVVDIGSIVKPMAQLALWDLVVKGRLSTSDTLGKYLPLRGNKAALPIDLVMKHRAGLPDIFGDDYEPMTREGLLEKINQCKLVYPPGKGYLYSNSGYSLLAMVIERITNGKFEDELRKVEFGPADCPSIGYIRPRWSRRMLTHGYELGGEDWGSPLDHFWFYDGPGWNLRGNGGMLSTMSDLAKWARAVGTPGKVFSQKLLGLWLPNVYGPSAKPGSGWAFAGGNGYFDTVAYFNQSLDLTVVMASNVKHREIEDFGSQIFKLARQMASPEHPGIKSED
ncbi:MAG: beta-lactamase family protein [Armatimonadetes bacterium]|nr:beta-lactamase family protein [Armatimonadota bacterium]